MDTTTNSVETPLLREILEPLNGRKKPRLTEAQLRARRAAEQADMRCPAKLVRPQKGDSL